MLSALAYLFILTRYLPHQKLLVRPGADTIERGKPWLVRIAVTAIAAEQSLIEPYLIILE